jgi:hypothetical protein
VSEIYQLTDRERWAKLAVLHRGWGNELMFFYYTELLAKS